MTVPSSAQHPEAGTTRAVHKARRLSNSTVTVALVATLAVAAIVVYTVVRWDRPQESVTTQAQPVTAPVVVVPPASLAISPVTEAEHFSPERVEWYKAGPTTSLAEEWATYTDRYWTLAEASGVGVPAAPARNDAYYTEQYWKLAADAGVGASVDAVAPSAALGDYAYYPERYWDLAQAHALATAGTETIIPSAAEGDYAYYTERYWKLAEGSSAVNAEAPGAWSYYTEQYWALSKGQD